jgi:hypothetical protein
MKKLRLALIPAIAMLLATAAPISAITYGELDNGEHPYVGFMIFFDPTEPGWFSCSGTLLDSTTFLTAGHCTFNIGTNGQAAGSSGGNDVWVTFDDTSVLEGFPPRNPANPYPARRDWLNANSDYIRGTSYPNPDYDNFADFPDNHDVGVVVLSKAASVNTFGELAPLGTIDALAAVRSNRNNALIETVGYGIQSVQPKPMDVDSRYKSTSRIVEVNGNISQGGNVHTLNNPSAVGGRGGSCFGDSGGPLFVNNTNKVVAVVSFGFSPTCHGADYSWRVDTQPSYDFILPFLN